MEHDAAFYFKRAFERYDAKDVTGGNADLDQAILLAPNNLEYRQIRGEFRYQAEQYELAIEDYSVIASLNMDIEILEDAYHKLAFSHEAVGAVDELLMDMGWLIGHGFVSSSLYSWRSYHLSLRGQYEEALEDLNKALEIHPDTINYLLPRARLYERLGRYEEQIADLSTVLALGNFKLENDAIFLLDRAAAYFRLGNKAQAYADFDRAIALGAIPFTNDAARYFAEMYP